MKNLFKYTLGVLFAGLTMTACSPDEFEGADPNGIPTVSGIDYQIAVDQETNQMVASYSPAAGTYPIWILNGTQYSTLQEVGYNNPEAGTYTVELRLGNRNGISQTGIKKEFTFNETKVDYTADFRRLCNKEWRFANREVAHLACGPAGTAGTEWWSAAPNEKKDFGMYDDRITLTNDNRKGGTFTYNAGEDGLTYVNYGATKLNPDGKTEDFDKVMGNQTSTWSFEQLKWEDADGQVTTQQYIQLAANTAFPYISSDAQYENPLFRVETLTSTKLVLIYEAPDRSIAWRFIFTSEADQRLVEESGFDASSDFNMWKGITPTMSFYYNPDPNWGNEQTPKLEATFKGGDNDYSFTVPDQCYADWQAQVHFHTDLSANAATNYDFSCILNADRDISGVIIKLTNETDAEAIIEEHIDLKAGQDYVLWKSNVPGKDLSQLKLATDYGHATGETHISLSNIVLKDHANDDGTIVPQEGIDENDPANVKWVAVDSPLNLGAGFNTKGVMNFWWADAGWSQIGDPQFSYENGVYTITANDATAAEWQAQNSIQDVDINIEAGVAYDMSVKIVSNMDLDRYTVKLCEQDDDDNTLIYRGNLVLEQGENIVQFANLVAAYSGNKDKANPGAFSKAKFFVDLGGCPAGIEIKISEIIVQKHVFAPNPNDSDPTKVDWAATNAAENLGAPFNTKGEMNFWWSDAGWSQIGDPKFSYANGVYTITANDATSAEWQAQNSIQNVDLNIEAGQAYDISVKLVANQDLDRYTLKLCEQDDDDNTLLYRGDLVMEQGENIVQFANLVAAYNGNKDKANPGAFSKAKFFIDLGGCPAGFEVKVSDIIVQKHKLK